MESLSNHVETLETETPIQADQSFRSGMKKLRRPQRLIRFFSLVLLVLRKTVSEVGADALFQS